MDVVVLSNSLGFISDLMAFFSSSESPDLSSSLEDFSSTFLISNYCMYIILVILHIMDIMYVP